VLLCLLAGAVWGCRVYTAPGLQYIYGIQEIAIYGVRVGQYARDVSHQDCLFIFDELIVENLRNAWAIGTSDANSSTEIAVRFTDGSPEQHICINLSMPVGLVFGLAAVEGGKSLDGHVLKLGDQDLALEDTMMFAGVEEDATLFFVEDADNNAGQYSALAEMAKKMADDNTTKKANSTVVSAADEVPPEPEKEPEPEPVVNNAS